MKKEVARKLDINFKLTFVHITTHSSERVQSEGNLLNDNLAMCKNLQGKK